MALSAHDHGDDVFDDEAVQRLRSFAQDLVAQGRLPSCQIALGRNGTVVAETFGAAPQDCRYVIFSITKALVAGAVWALISDGHVAADTRVAELVPEFATNGKDAVTVAHLLTHTAGFPRAPMRPEEGATREGRLRRFAQWRLDWAPGTATGYHASSAHWVLAEVIERASGMDYREHVRARVCGPLGLPRLELGVAPGGQGDIAQVEIVGVEPQPGDTTGVDLETLLAEASPRRLLRYNDPQVLQIGVPGAGAVGTAADVVRYFAALLRDDSGVWDPEVLRDATGRIRNALVDPVTKVPVNRTLGLVVAGDDGNAWLREMGKAVGPRTFAASGIGGQIAWADPDSGLAFCFLTNGIDANVVEAFLRSSKVCTLAGLCAGQG